MQNFTQTWGEFDQTMHTHTHELDKSGSLHMHIFRFRFYSQTSSFDSSGPRSIDTTLVCTCKHLRARFISTDSALHRFSSIDYAQNGQPELPLRDLSSVNCSQVCLKKKILLWSLRLDCSSWQTFKPDIRSFRCWSCMREKLPELLKWLIELDVRKQRH